MPKISGLQKDLQDAYLSELGKEYKRAYSALRQLNLRYARAELANATINSLNTKRAIRITPMYLGRNPIIKVDGTGYIVFNIKGVGKKLQSVIMNNNEEFMKEVFNLSQEYVPIDKRYAEATSIRYVDTGRKRVKFNVSSAQQGQFENYFGTVFDTRRQRLRRGTWQSQLDTEEFSRTSGYYEKSEADFIKEMFRGPARDKKYTDIYFNPTTGTIWRRKDKKLSSTFNTGLKLTNNPFSTQQLKDMNITRSKQPSGGFQELKNGGNIVTKYNEIFITYSAFDKTKRDSTFNYARLQHDNLKFKHYRGKKALFLYRSFNERRRQWLDKVKKEVANSMQKGV